MFSLCAFVEDMETSPTDKPCLWNRPGKLSSTPLPLRQMQQYASDVILGPDASDVLGQANPCKMSPDAVRSLFMDLFKGSDALITTVIPGFGKATKTSTRPMTVAEAVTSCSSTAEVIPLFKWTHPPAICDEICKLTNGQSENTLWRDYRHGRLTSSIFKAACTYSGSSMNNSVVKTVMGLYQPFSTPATRYGLECEGGARDVYAKLHSKYHSQVNVQESGLHINGEMPFLGASPDGMIRCPICGPGVLEIKCPYSKRKETTEQACQDNKFGVLYENGSIRLKPTSKWMYQIQGQMLVTGVEYCDFVINTEKTISMARIRADKAFQTAMLQRLTSFYERFIAPALVSDRA